MLQKEVQIDAIKSQILIVEEIHKYLVCENGGQELLKLFHQVLQRSKHIKTLPQCHSVLLKPFLLHQNRQEPEQAQQ